MEDSNFVPACFQRFVLLDAWGHCWDALPHDVLTDVMDIGESLDVAKLYGFREVWYI